jgi:hypothetical protein
VGGTSWLYIEISLFLTECFVVGLRAGKFGWQGLPFVYDRVRIQDYQRYRRHIHLCQIFMAS